jgi:hypothetical protein
MSIGLKPSCREPTATPAIFKLLTPAREQPSGKQPARGAHVPDGNVWRDAGTDKRAQELTHAVGSIDSKMFGLGPPR